MLKSLFIENIAVIEKTTADFSGRFNVLTGETGAGKSIIIDAINAVLGERTSKELIRTGSKNAVVTAVFSNLSSSAANALNENGFFADENGEYTVVRVLSNSSSNIKINGQPISAGVLRSFSNKLINIHGQHDNQALLLPDNHYLYIDLLAENNNLLSEYSAEFKHFNATLSALKKIDIDEDEKLRKIDLLKFQIDELSSADIKVGEFAQLKENLLIAKSAEKHKKALDEITLLLCGDENRDGIVSELLQIDKIVLKNDLKKLEEDKANLDKAYDLLCTFKDKVETYNEDLSSGLYGVDSIQDRIELLSTLMRKYGNSEEELLKFLNNAEKELKAIEFNDEEIIRLENELDLSQVRLIKAAERLTESRKNAAQKFESEVESVLKELNMPSVKIKADFKKGKYSRIGCDEIQFLICTNAGEDFKPLSKIASGGELSRIMLAIKSVLCDKDDVDTLIFDEIDSGISGLAADKVGIQLKKVALTRQVICVTHLAQIAACASHHYLISKNESGGRTYTEVTHLNDAARIKEIARIMGGSNISDSMLNSAKELLESKLQ